jgi:hypothetical protein
MNVWIPSIFLYVLGLWPLCSHQVSDSQTKRVQPERTAGVRNPSLLRLSLAREMPPRVKKGSEQPTSPAQGKILIRCVSPLGCRITIDGELFATLEPRTSKKALLEYGEHLIETEPGSPGLGGVASLSYVINATQQRVVEVSPQSPSWHHILQALVGKTVLVHTKAGLRGFDRDKKEWVMLNPDQQITKISQVCSGFLNRFLLVEVENGTAVFLLPEGIDVSLPDGQKLDVLSRDCRKGKQILYHQTLEDASREGWTKIRTERLTSISDKNGGLVESATHSYPADYFSRASSYIQIRGDRTIGLGKIEDCPIGGTLVPVTVPEVTAYIPAHAMKVYIDNERLDDFDSDAQVMLCR